MGRPQMVDITKLVVLTPYNTWRCVVCDKILIGLQRSNAKRHYKLLHPEIVLQRIPRPPKTPKKAKPPVQGLTSHKVCRRKTDIRKFAELMPDGKRCRCLLCEKVLVHKASNVQRHYSIFHPAVLVQLSVYLDTNNQEESQNADAILPSTGEGVMLETDETKETAVENLKNADCSNQFENLFIEKTEMPEEEDEDQSDGTDKEDSLEVRPVPESTTSSQQNMITSASTVPARAPTSTATSTGSEWIPFGDDAFYLQYLGNKFSKYSARTRNTVQFQINRILYKADMGCFEETEARLEDADFA